jgi:hypothetical protein
MSTEQEKVKLDANEVLLNSRAYLLLAVTAEGAFVEVFDTEDLNPAELLGFSTFTENVIDEGDYLEDQEDEDVEEK